MNVKSKVGRIAKLIGSLLVLSFDYCRTIVCKALGKNIRGTSVVLFYHSVSSEQRQRFARQMDTLIRWTQPIPVDIDFPPANHARCAAVTFDDGFQNVIDNALPELKARGIPSTIFIVTDNLGRPPEWESYASESDRLTTIMSLEELQSLPSDLVTIGSQTMTHPMLTLLGEQEAKKQLAESRTKLERILNRPVKLFGFPYGAFNDNLVQWCREAGYDRVFTILPVLAFSSRHEFVTGRVWAEPSDWSVEFCLKLLGAYRWLPVAFAFKRRILSWVYRADAAKLSRKAVAANRYSAQGTYTAHPQGKVRDEAPTPSARVVDFNSINKP